MIIRSKAPLRLGLAGGGTDVSAYSDKYGGAILNATINKFAYATLTTIEEKQIRLKCQDVKISDVFTDTFLFDLKQPGDKFILLKGVHNRIVQEFNIKQPLYYQLETFVEAPPGSGLGSSSTLVVAIVAAFTEWLHLPLGEYDIARLAYSIEREDLGLSGGKQDQYAATFGGFNFMEFYSNDKVIVNPLRIREEYIHEMEYSMLIYYTGTSRVSSKIIDGQISNMNKAKASSIEAMHQLKSLAFEMKENILMGNLKKIGSLLNDGWMQKKATADEISNDQVETIYKSALQTGAIGGKISGAGGGGFMMFYIEPSTLYEVINCLNGFGGRIERIQFYPHGVITWKI